MPHDPLDGDLLAELAEAAAGLRGVDLEVRLEALADVRLEGRVTYMAATQRRLARESAVADGHAVADVHAS